MKNTSSCETRAGEPAVDLGEAEPEREGHRVREHQRRRAGAALAAVDVDEVDAATPLGHLGDQVVPELHVADRGLDADGQAGRVGHQLDEVEHRVDVVEDLVAARRGAVLAGRDAADVGDLLADLGARQHPAETRLGALGQLDLDRLHRRGRDQVDEPRQLEGAVLVPAAEVRRPDLEHDVAAVAVVRRQRALAGVVPAAGERGALVERLDRVGGQRAEAHPRDVDHRRRAEREPSAARLAHHLARRERHPLVAVPRRRRTRSGERAVLDHRPAPRCSRGCCRCRTRSRSSPAWPRSRPSAAGRG